MYVYELHKKRVCIYMCVYTHTYIYVYETSIPPGGLDDKGDEEKKGEALLCMGAILRLGQLGL